MRRIDLGPRPTGREELSGWYSAALSAQAASGLSVTDYAELIGVTAATLYQWRRRLAAAGDDAPAPGNLVEVTIARPTPSAISSSRNNLLVRIGDGRRSIEVPRAIEADDLRRLIAVLESC